MSAKRPDPDPKSSTAPMVVLIGGALLVAVLVGWAVTRSMQAPTQVSVVPEPASPITTTTPAQPAATPPVTPPPQPPENAAVPRAEVSQLKEQIARAQVTVIDVRDLDSYVKEHIPGALHVPLARIEGEVAYLPKDKPIVTYCT